MGVLADGLVIAAMVYLCHTLFTYRTRAVGTPKRRDTIFKDLPGWPLIGNTIEVFQEATETLELMAIKASKYGHGYGLTLPFLRLIDISRPDWIEYVQKTHFENYPKGSLFASIMCDVFGEGIFTSDGEKWKKSRQATSAIFSATSFKEIIAPSIQNTLDDLIDFLAFTSDNNQAVDFSHLMHKYTLSAFLQMTFGKKTQFLTASGGETKEVSQESDAFCPSSEEFEEAFDFAQHEIEFRFTLGPLWKFYERMNVPLHRKMKSACECLSRYTYSLIDRRQGGFGKEKGEFRHSDLLALFMQARDARGTILGRDELKDAVLNLIVAGRDTTASALSWTFFHLIMNPNVIQKVREESRQIFDMDPNGRVTYENYKRFVWTQAVISESLRLHPSVPKNMKFAVKCDKIPNGPLIEAGDGVRWSDWQMGRTPSLWGPDCAEFKPERWVDESGKLKQFGQFKFHAFNGGPRVCLGINLATLQMVSVVVELLDNFDFEFEKDWYENVPKTGHLPGQHSDYLAPKYRNSLTLPMEYPMMLKLRRRKSPLN